MFAAAVELGGGCIPLSHLRAHDFMRKQTRETDITRKLKTAVLMLESRDGYRIEHLRELFGVQDGEVRRWVRRGLFGAEYQRKGRARIIREADVCRFIHQHHTEYSLATVNQKWLTSLVFVPGIQRQIEIIKRGIWEVVYGI